MKNTMSEPTPGLERFLLQLFYAAMQQRTEHFEFDPHPCLAIGGCCYDNAAMEQFFWSLKHEWTNTKYFPILKVLA